MSAVLRKQVFDLAERLGHERTARLAAEARVKELTEALESIAHTAGNRLRDVFDNPADAACYYHIEQRARSTLHPGDGG